MPAIEFEREPVTPEKLQPARYFAASYAGEHVAGTEFVIGAMFVAWGVGAGDIFSGLLLGNLLAVLTWGLICAPIATDTRLTLYAYLEKIAGPGTIKVYSLVNGILFCILAGAMITVSASAVRILFGIPPQVEWYPTSIGFVLVACAVGAVVVYIAARGFKRVAQFAEVCAPWMVLMFLVGALTLYPVLASNMEGAGFMDVSETLIWQQTSEELNFWHVAAFAWICNFAMHGSLSDMTLLRYARKPQYGYFSALGMFIGHYMAWVCAGVMGAGAALILKTQIIQLDAGEVAFQALGAAGVLAVIIAGWTTSNPTLYRAGLAFQSLNPRWDRTTITVITGIVTTIISCFPFVFTKLLDFVGLMALTLAPVGALIVTEHWLLPRLGMTRYWSGYQQRWLNPAALITWVVGLGFAYLLNQQGLHLFFLIPPTFVFCMVLYAVLCRLMGATGDFPESVAIENQENERQQQEQQCLAGQQSPVSGGTESSSLMKWLAVGSLVACLAMGAAVWMDSLSLESLRQWLILPSLVYFAAAVIRAARKESE